MSTPDSARERRLLEEGSAALGVALGERHGEQLLRFIELVYEWNRSAGLTTIAREDSIRLHLLDSLSALRVIDSEPVLDVGTGAGLPGIVLAVVRKDAEFCLVESNRRKCSFLLEAVRVLRLCNVRVVESDIEAFRPEEPFPIVISRAFRAPVTFLAIASRLVAAGGSVVAMAADPSDDDIRGLCGIPDYENPRVLRLRLPGGDEPRTLLAFRRTGV